MSGLINSAGSRSGVIGTTELDIEEGQFTFTIKGSDGTAGSWAQTGTTGDYRKVGSLVWFSISGYLTNVGSYSGTLKVIGLPFTSNDMSILSIAYYPSNVVDAAWRAAMIPASQDYVKFQSGTYMDTVAPYSEVATGTYLMVAGVYPTAS